MKWLTLNAQRDKRRYDSIADETRSFRLDKVDRRHLDDNFPGLTKDLYIANALDMASFFEETLIQ